VALLQLQLNSGAPGAIGETLLSVTKDREKLVCWCAVSWVSSRPHLAGVVYSPSRARVAAPPAPAAAISTSSAAASPMRAMASSSASDT
jgi:hypothetical protein